MLLQVRDIFEVFSYDVRGHGGSSTPDTSAPELYSFDRFAGDLRCVVESVCTRVGTRAMYFAGHSFSAAAMYHLGGNHNFAPWQSVVTFDATMLPSDDLAQAESARAASADRISRTLRRRSSWSDPANYRSAISRPGAFDNWDSEMMTAHCRATVVPAADGSVRLACRPEVEAAVYAGVMDDQPFQGLRNFTVPAHLIGADENAGASWVGQVQQRAAARMQDGRASVLTGTGHLMPFEQPKQCAELIRAMLT